MPKKVVEKFRFNELKIEKVKLFTQRVQPKLFALTSLNIGGCLASCLTFRPFLPLDLSNLVAYKKTSIFFS